MNTDYIDNLIAGGLRITSNLVVLLIGIAVVWFIWNVIKYTMSAEDADKTKAKDQMIRGIIAITVSVSIWGLVAILQTMFITNNTGTPSNTNLRGMIPGAGDSGINYPSGPSRSIDILNSP